MTLEITLPTLHAGQAKIWRARKRLNVLRCGRRWGKTKFFVTLACDAAIKGRAVGFFAPEYKQLKEPYDDILAILAPLKRQASRQDGTIRLTTGGLVDFWPLTDNPLAGRGREYDLILIDEAGYTKKGQMLDIWRKSIRPTMLTRPGAVAWVGGTPKGEDSQDFFWLLHFDEKLRFEGQHYAPTSDNPLVSREEIEKERRDNHPLVFQQEILAEWVSWAGVAFFSLDKLLVDGNFVPLPTACDSIFMVIDTAVKGGFEHDGTAIGWWATSGFGQWPLIGLDWELEQIDGALLERAMPGWLARGEHYAQRCGARFGFTGVYIEDAQSGAILLQQAAARGWPAQALPAVLTQAGKDGRALNVSGAVWRGEIKLAEPANKVTTFKGATQNHLISQITGFRIGDRDAAKRADDLLDVFTYAGAVALGNAEGIG